jgi:hypothetical protein
MMTKIKDGLMALCIVLGVCLMSKGIIHENKITVFIGYTLIVMPIMIILDMIRSRK